MAGEGGGSEAVQRAAKNDTVARTPRRDSDIEYTLPRPVKLRLLYYRRRTEVSRRKEREIELT
jgi:hypothetical protein